jgi:hypothetical protein
MFTIHCFNCYFVLISSDYMQALAMKFLTKEEAIAFADKQGMASLFSFNSTVLGTMIHPLFDD